MKTVRYAMILIGSFVVLSCTQNKSTSTNDPSPSQVPAYDVSIKALISSNGLSVKTPEPADEVSNTISFDVGVTPGTSLDKKISIKNDSEDSIELDVSLISENYKIINNRCPSVLPKNDTCAIAIRFLSRNLYNGVYVDTLQINSNPALAFNLSAEVINHVAPTEGNVNLASEFTSFSEMPFSDLPVRTRILLTNQSDDKIAPAGSLAPQLSGAGVTAYGILVNRCSSPLSPHKSCSITLTTNRKIKNYNKYPEVQVTLGGMGSLRLACSSNETFNSQLKKCEDVSAPVSPNVELITQYPSSESNLKFKFNSCEEISHVLYKESTEVPTAQDLNWISCDLNQEYSYDLSTLYVPSIHSRTINYWVKDLAGNVAEKKSFSIEYYPEALKIGSKLNGDKIHVSQSKDFTIEGGVPSTYFSFDDDSHASNGATLSSSGHFVPSVDSVGTIRIKLRDSNLPQSSIDTYQFSVFNCAESETFNLSLNNCFLSEQDCKSSIDYATVAKKIWNNDSGQYSSCQLLDCQFGYTKNVAMNVCDINHYTITLQQPSFGGSLVASSTSIDHGGSGTVTYNSLIGAKLTSWQGCSTSSGNTCNLTNVQSNKTISATIICDDAYQLVNNICTLKSYSVTLIQPQVGGSLVANPSTINYDQSGIVNLTISTGYKLDSWSGCSSVTGNICTLSNVRSNKTVSVALICDDGYSLVGGVCQINTFLITAAQPSGNGINAPASVNYGSSATITYIEPSGYKFISWTGDCSGQSNPCIISNVKAPKTVGINVDKVPYDVTTSYAFAGTMQMDQCVAVTATVKDVLGSNINRSVVTTIPISGDSAVSVYSNSGCSSALSSLSVAANQSQASFYVKNVSATQATQSLTYNLSSFVTSKSVSSSKVYARAMTCQDAYNKGFKSTSGSTSSGQYSIDPDGNSGTYGSLNVYCEVDSSNSSSWTMISSGGSNCGGSGRFGSTTGYITPDQVEGCGYFTNELVRTIAGNSTTVRLRTGSVPNGTDQVQSSGNDTMTALRNGSGWQYTSAPSEFDGWNWNAPCGGNGNGWPDMYQSCGNGGGVHWMVYAGAYVYQNRISGPAPYTSTWLK